MKLYVKLLFLVGGWVGGKKTKLMLYSTLVEVEVGVELGNKGTHIIHGFADICQK